MKTFVTIAAKNKFVHYIMEFKIKCSNCDTIYNITENDKIGDYLCNYLIKDDGVRGNGAIVRCTHIACRRCKICFHCKMHTQKYYKLLE